MDDRRAHRARVLVVDDDEDVLRLLGLKLERAGFAVDLARTPDAAVQAARRAPPDIALLGDGLVDGAAGDLAAALAPPGAAAEGPVLVVLSPRSAEEDIEAALALGAEDYIVKPFSPREVVHRLRVALLRRRAPSRVPW